MDTILDEIEPPVTVVFGAIAQAPPETIRWQCALKHPAPLPYVFVDPSEDFPLDAAARVIGIRVNPEGFLGHVTEDLALGWRQRIAGSLSQRPDLRLENQIDLDELGVSLLVYEPAAAGAGP